MTAQDPVADLVAELADAEAAEAQARQDAERAKAKAAELREGEQPAQRDPEVTGTAQAGGRRNLFRTAPLAVLALLTGAALTVTALMLRQHGQVAGRHSREHAAIDAARNGVVALLSIDHTRAKDDVQRVLALSTGAFRDDFARDADDFI
ncbi:MAG: hypothetical protein ACR2JM_07705 [Mycobacterium sp.]